jgi:hypothetical protein
MLRVLGICRPVNGFLKVGDMISLLRRFPRFCRPSVFFSGHTEPSLIPWAIQQRTEALFAIVGAAAADRVICYTDAGKTPTRFSFFDNLGTVSTSFYIFCLPFFPNVVFLSRSGISPQHRQAHIPFGRSFNFQGTRGKYPQYIGSEKVHLWIPF